MKPLLVWWLLALTTIAADQDLPEWSRRVTAGKGPGTFETPPDLDLVYRFGWSGMKAARAKVKLLSNGDTIEIHATGATEGLPRKLFPLDIEHQATANKGSLRPIDLYQEEHYADETVKTQVRFGHGEVVRLREVASDKKPAKPKKFKYSPVFDLQTALLYVRSQPLKDGDEETLVVYPSDSPYLATVKVVGHEEISVCNERRKAIRLDLALQSIDKKMRLKRHKLFKRGRGWLSDDATRIPLRIEADIFIGYVFCELERAQQLGKR
jgi:Protein of unknown function (DUF3108)